MKSLSPAGRLRALEDFNEDIYRILGFPADRTEKMRKQFAKN